MSHFFSLLLSCYKYSACYANSVDLDQSLRSDLDLQCLPMPLCASLGIIGLIRLICVNSFRDLL